MLDGPDTPPGEDNLVRPVAVDVPRRHVRLRIRPHRGLVGEQDRQRNRIAVVARERVGGERVGRAVVDGDACQRAGRVPERDDDAVVGPLRIVVEAPARDAHVRRRVDHLGGARKREVSAGGADVDAAEVGDDDSLLAVAVDVRGGDAVFEPRPAGRLCVRVLDDELGVLDVGEAAAVARAPVGAAHDVGVQLLRRFNEVDVDDFFDPVPVQIRRQRRGQVVLQPPLCLVHQRQRRGRGGRRDRPVLQIVEQHLIDGVAADAAPCQVDLRDRLHRADAAAQRVVAAGQRARRALPVGVRPRRHRGVDASASNIPFSVVGFGFAAAPPPPQPATVAVKTGKRVSRTSG